MKQVGCNELMPNSTGFKMILKIWRNQFSVFITLNCSNAWIRLSHSHFFKMRIDFLTSDLFRVGYTTTQFEKSQINVIKISGSTQWWNLNLYTDIILYNPKQTEGARSESSLRHSCLGCLRNLTKEIFCPLISDKAERTRTTVLSNILKSFTSNACERLSCHNRSDSFFTKPLPYMPHLPFPNVLNISFESIVLTEVREYSKSGIWRTFSRKHLQICLAKATVCLTSPQLHTLA